MSEEWRKVERNDNYEVSSLGRVRRVKAGRGATVGKVLRACVANSKGYLMVGLRKDNKLKSAKVAHLVAEAFIGPRPAKLQVNHKDGVKTNNAETNLEYMTGSENILHAYRTGLRPKGKNHHWSKQLQGQ